MDDWLVYTGDGEPHDGIARLPDPPPWRTFYDDPATPFDREKVSGMSARWPQRASAYQPDPHTVEMVNAALYLRRPLLVTGDPGVGKSSIAYAVARELRLGSVLRWPITSRSTLKDGLYRYDAIGRLEEANLTRTALDDTPAGAGIGRYLRLGPLGTALAPYEVPRVLLVDEIDKSDIDLPNDLLDVFEEGAYEIPELARVADSGPVPVTPADDGHRVTVTAGQVRCRAFPFAVLTSNGERDFPPAFLRRCVRLHLPTPDRARLSAIVRAHLGSDGAHADRLISMFLDRRSVGELATDQLLHAVYLARHANGAAGMNYDRLAELVFQHLNHVR
ncbi:MoxR family ATPase [Sphaerisporangium sp. TRM90804]|uniref:AAA family ATPase n=1 Tax=Sphaerisporangium sp. TRM90804 TaxID=3031113 RepID=UPI00244A26C0|nr:MoxR family ATPase [Sphaerisporangium sp. TRM90804]MDH2424029.1 MoxR family ATPase [Sphaerisporangium sp. TRM90804]